MAWLQTLHHLFNPAKVERIAASLAAENHSLVWERIVAHGVGMRAAELRGYIRARAGAIVRVAVDRYIAVEEIKSDSIRQRLVDLSQEALVTNLSQDLREHVSRTERKAA